MSNADIKKRPKSKLTNRAYKVAKIIISGVPFLGGPTAELFSAIIVDPLSKRREEWIESIVKRILELEDKVKGFKIEELSKNNMFLTTIMHASQAAIRNHQEEKLEALRNAVLNASLPNPPDEDMQLMFLNFIDTFTPWHIRILMFLNDPNEWAEKREIRYPDQLKNGLAEALELAFPELKNRWDFISIIREDLFIRRLIGLKLFHQPMSKKDLPGYVTDIGKKFIKFITSPIDRQS